jgi:hypothetical protein
VPIAVPPTSRRRHHRALNRDSGIILRGLKLSAAGGANSRCSAESSAVLFLGRGAM